MAESGGFREAGSAGGVLNVDRVGRLERAADAVELFGRDAAALLDHLVPKEQAAGRPAFDCDDLAQAGILRAAYSASIRGGDFGADLGEHREIVRGLELINEEQGNRIAL